MSQYLQEEDIARNFALFYQLFRHYAADFAAERYFSSGNRERMSKADPTEAIAVAAMLFSRIAADVRAYRLKEHTDRRAAELSALFFRQIKGTAESEENACQMLESFLVKQRQAGRIKEENGLLSLEEKILEYRAMKALDRLLSQARASSCSSPKQLEAFLGRASAQKKEEHRRSSLKISDFIFHSYKLLEASSHSLALTYFTADLSGNPDCAAFLADHPCREFLDHCQDLLLFKKEEQLRQLLD